MRRKDREITDRAAIEAILRRATVCRIGLVGKDGPYVVPMSFGYDAGRLYLHSARDGRKLDLVREDPRVCFEVDLDCEVVKRERPCEWTLRYRSVIGFGRAVLVEDPEEKRRGLEVILRHHGGDPSALPERSLDGVSLIRIEIREMTGKQSGY
jgi:hypothetical protein